MLLGYNIFYQIKQQVKGGRRNRPPTSEIPIDLFLHFTHAVPVLIQVPATLIDNIFTNELTNQIISGLLINDISDHLPIFSLTRSSPKRLNIP